MLRAIGEGDGREEGRRNGAEAETKTQKGRRARSGDACRITTGSNNGRMKARKRETKGQGGSGRETGIRGFALGEWEKKGTSNATSLILGYLARGRLSQGYQLNYSVWRLEDRRDETDTQQLAPAGTERGLAGFGRTSR